MPSVSGRLWTGGDENGAEQRHYLTQLRASRAEVDRELRRVQLKRLQLLQSVQAAQENESDLAAGQEGGNSDAGSARLALSAVNDEHDELLSQQKWLSAQLGDALSASHTSFHSQWGQVRDGGSNSAS